MSGITRGFQSPIFVLLPLLLAAGAAAGDDIRLGALAGDGAQRATHPADGAQRDGLLGHGDKRDSRPGGYRPFASTADAEAPAAKPVRSQAELDDLLADIHPRGKGSVLIVECNGAYGYATIQSAIDAAADGDVIVVLPNTCNTEGRYYERINFLGKAITVQSVYPTDPAIVAATIIDGEQLDTVVTFESGEGPDSVLDGLTITNGDASSGGGVRCSSSTAPTLIRCNINGNTASSGSGVNCESYSYPTLTDCDIRDNTATYGGGVSIGTYSYAMLAGCTISKNAASSGGGVYCDYDSYLSLTNCAIIGNVASASYTQTGGGGVFCRAAEVTLTSCMISENTAASDGGGIQFTSSSTLVLTQCTITENTALSGGGVFSASSHSNLINCTISGNTASSGGGLYSIGSSSPELTNCILWGDTPQEIFVATGTPVVSYCNVQGGWSGTGNIDLDPEFAFPDDFHLTDGSPCIDTGTNTPSSGLPDEDVDGNPRPIDGNGDSQAVADMGAYEFNPAAASIAVSPTRVVFYVAEGQGVSAPQEFMIRNAGGGTLQWSLDWNATWLQADVTQGESTGEVDCVMLTADASTLVHGSYSTLLTISDPSATNDPRIVEVVLNVNITANVPGAYATIQAAIDAATVPGDEVVVADGTYTGAGNKNLDFGGKVITVRSASGDPALCVIDCEGDGRGFYFHSNESHMAQVAGFTIRNGYDVRGGGVYCRAASPTLNNLLIIDNSAYHRGGGVYCSSGSRAALNRCTITANAAFCEGGGIYCNSAAASLLNCIISANTASDVGGGIHCDSGDPRLINCTISGNTASTGGGIYSTGYSNPTLINCILWADTPQEIFVDTGTPVVSYCDVQGGWTGTGNIDLDPAFALADDFHLISNSPCVDVGTNNPPDGPPNEDADGNTRPLDGDGDSTAIADMGAYEFNPAAPGIAVSPTRVVFFIAEGQGISAPQEFTIRNAGGGTLQWTLDWNAPWLQADVTQGESTGEVDNVILTADASTLPHGSYATLLTISDPSATNDPRIVEVVLNVNITANVPGAYATIQAAIDAATVSGDEVVVADGTYAGAGNKNLDFGGKAITVRSASGDAALCAIDCEGDGRGFIFQSGETNASLVKGIAIRNGSASSGGGVYSFGSKPVLMDCEISENSSTSPSYAGGGGVCLSYSSLTLFNCKISGNVASDDGGGIRCSDSHATLINCRISDNSAGDHSGGVYCYYSNTKLINCTISGNMASDDGGGVYADKSKPTLNNCTVSGNEASSFGGGVYCYDSSAIMSGCTISENTAVFGGGLGCIFFSDATLTNCTIRGNESTADGAGLYCDLSEPALTNCSIDGNTASDDGGGLYCDSSDPTLTNCTINANTATDLGGGICCYLSDPILTNCTISTNTTSGVGGGVYCSGASRPVLTNCILWGDLPQEIYVYSTGSPVVTYCDVQGGWPGTGNIGTDPGLAFNDDFHLADGSPCIDAGTNSPPLGLPNEDIDGNPRPADGNGDTQAVADMGAYEFNPAAAGIAISPARIVLFAPEGQVGVLPQSLMIRNAGGGTLQWALDWNAPWLQADVTQGESTGEVDNVILTADASTLPHGVYSTLLTVSDPLSSNSPRIVALELNVTTTLQVPAEYATIQSAIDAAVASGDQVMIADGIYAGSGNKDLDFNGKEITVRSASGNPALCIIDCEGDGRGFYFHNGETSSSTVHGLTIRNGSAYYGGGVSCSDGSSPTVINCTISQNNADSLGGGVYCEHSGPALDNCKIIGNTATNSGGGAYCGGISNLRMVDCTLVGNTASFNGGGLFCGFDSDPTLINCTIAENAASSEGGGVYSYRSAPSFFNCILWGDLPHEIHVNDGPPLLTYCNVQGGYTGSGNIDADPLFVDPDGADDVPGTEDDDFRLLPDSPCIDAGDPDFVAAPGETDFDGRPRVMGCRVDIGAYEFIAGVPGSGDLDGSGTLDGDDIAIFIEELLAGSSPATVCVADLNADDHIDGLDIQLFTELLLGGG